MAFIWMITSIVLTNSFKGSVKSNSIMPNSYGTNWTSLLQLLGFMLIFGYDPVLGTSCASMDDWLSRSRKLLGRDGTFPELRNMFKVESAINTDIEHRATFALVGELTTVETAMSSGKTFAASHHR